MMAFVITNRRYTGSKAKIVNWIMDLIDGNCKNMSSFCDMFAGTGVIASMAVNKYSKVIINDFLYSNNIIYKAFFSQDEYSVGKIADFALRQENILLSQINPNYMSINFGGKFFSMNDALRIGNIRENLEQEKDKLNNKEFAILLASLLYSADKVANTVGHFDAYIKDKEIKNAFRFELIEPMKVSSKIEIYHDDANKLCRNIQADIVYIDPPYNSRQYSRFYHILENITKWDKPKLYGIALKPSPENMSEYCRTAASQVFDDLIINLNCKYAIVSYNNTYNSKSKSSKNKIELDFIVETLKKRGLVKQFEKQHTFFNVGKTAFIDHKEYIFILEVKD